MTIVELREKRAKLWDTMGGFLDTHRDRKAFCPPRTMPFMSIWRRS